MTLLFGLQAGLVVLVLLAAAWTVLAREAFSAVVGFVVYGFLLALVWLSLGAPDVALTEAAIGAGLTGALLLGACAALRGTADAAVRPGIGVRLGAAVGCALITAGLAGAVLLLPEPAPSLAFAARVQMEATGLENPVTAVLLAYRAWDTLLEKIVLVLALMGVWSLAPNRLWGGRPDLPGRSDPDGVLGFLARVLPPVGFLVAVYVFWVGATDAGGAFPSATILAAMGLLMVMAGLVNPPPTGRPALRVVLVLGALVFLAVGGSGFAGPGAFLAYPVRMAKPLILLIEAALIVSVAATLGLLVAGPPGRKP